MILALLGIAPQGADFLKWGSETLDQIRRELYLPESRLYAEAGGEGADKKVAFNWPAGVMLSALAAGAKVESKYKAWLREYADATRAYWNPAGPVPGYDVLPMPKPKDRYYDDNAWMCLALIETHEVLGDAKYLQWAREAFTFVWSGWDDRLGGGIYWRESERKSKNTCSNGPAAACAYRLVAAGSSKTDSNLDLVAKGDRIWNWTVKNLQDGSDKLYWDNLTLDGKVERSKWTYNTALMMRAALERAGRTSHLEADTWYRRGLSSLPGALARWLDPKTDAIQDAACFAHLLFETLLSYAKAAKNDELDARLHRALSFIRSQGRDANGHYGPNWNDTPSDPYKVYRLIDQASAARAFMVAAARKLEASREADGG